MEELTKRIRNARDYIIRDASGTIIQILCRNCGTVIQGWVDDDIVKTENIGGEKVQRIRQRFKRLANYAQVEFEMEDGASYTPPVCKKCAKAIKSKEVGEELFRDHLADMVKRGKVKEAEIDCKCKIKRFVGEKDVR